LADDFGEKTEAPTPKRLKDARKKGDVLKSREFATALVALAGVAWLIFFGPMLVAACKGVMAESFQFTRGDVEDFKPFRPLAAAGWKLLPAFGTLFAIVMAAGVASSAALGGVGVGVGDGLASGAGRSSGACGSG
jgi:flagellar biosynthetic protein FlhB